MKLGEYLKDTKAELTHVSWPTRKQAVTYVVMVIVVCVIMSLLLGLFDYVFSRLLTLIF